MARVLRLVLLGLVAWIVTVIALFPVAPVLERLRPNLGPVALEGVGGKLYRGNVARLRSTDDLLPLEFSDVRWSLAPTALPRGAAADVSFKGYGGGGAGRALREWDGDIVIERLGFSAEAKALEPLLPVPIAEFSGELVGTVDRLQLEAGLLTSFAGDLRWSEALLESPVPTALGTVELVVRPDGEARHRIELSAAGGDVAAEGTLSLTLGGDFTADVTFTAAPSASPAVLDALSRMAVPQGEGRFLLRREGNVGRLI